MNLHRVESQAEWQGVKASQRNGWQKLAANTIGIITPGNVITLIGFGLSLAGLVALLNDHYWLALIGLAVGRLLDIADGLAADYTDTKSPLGEVLDAGIDKLITALTVIALIVSGIVDWLILIGMALPHVLVAFLSMWASIKGNRLHPSRYGKNSMFLIWVALVGFVFAKALPDVAIIYGVSFVAGLVSIAFGIMALLDYVKDYKN